MFLSPAYLRPYFEFVRQNKRLYQVVLTHQEVFRTQNTFQKLFDGVFSPALDRFHFPEKEKPYIVHFYLGGLTAVVKAWLEKDCADTIEQVIDICMRCILPEGSALGQPEDEKEGQNGAD